MSQQCDSKENFENNKKKYSESSGVEEGTGNMENIPPPVAVTSGPTD